MSKRTDKIESLLKQEGYNVTTPEPRHSIGNFHKASNGNITVWFYEDYDEVHIVRTPVMQEQDTVFYGKILEGDEEFLLKILKSVI